MIHALSKQGNPRVPLCGDLLAVGAAVGEFDRPRVTCRGCWMAMSTSLPWVEWRPVVEVLLVARCNTTARAYPLVQLNGLNIDRWWRRWNRGLTPEQAVEERLANH